MARILLDKGLQAFPKLCTLDIQDAVEFYDKLQDLPKDYLLPLIPFDAVHLGNNYEGLFVPGLGTLCYQECASALFELLPQLIPITNPEIHAKLCSVRVESKNGYDLFWRVLELTVPAFDPTVPLQAPVWDHDTTNCPLVDVTSSTSAYRLRNRYSLTLVIAPTCSSKPSYPKTTPILSPPCSRILTPTAILRMSIS